MPQGKLKVKAKLPTGVKGKAISKKKDIQKKNRPALPRKTTRSLRDAITRTINDNIESDAKERATADGKTFRVLVADPVVDASGNKSSSSSSNQSASSKTKAKK